MADTRIYQSTNGDAWDLVREDAASEAYVRHTPNRASGGNVSQTPLSDFLRLQPHSAENQALVAILRAATTDQDLSQPAAPEVKGYIHEPKEDGGPFISVVLHPAQKPAVAIHDSLAEAETELERLTAAGAR